jgi:hypothetical protein
MRKSNKPRIAGSLTPEGTFVVQLRSDSDVPQRRLSGRVEHVMSGQSEHFTSLAGLLALMARWAPPAAASKSIR